MPCSRKRVLLRENSLLEPSILAFLDCSFSNADAKHKADYGHPRSSSNLLRNTPPVGVRAWFQMRLGRGIETNSGIMRNRKINLIQSCSVWRLLSSAAPVLMPCDLRPKRQTQVPATAPQVREVLPSYEGQNVVSVEIAGRPDSRSGRTPAAFWCSTKGSRFPRQRSISPFQR